MRDAKLVVETARFAAGFVTTAASDMGRILDLDLVDTMIVGALNERGDRPISTMSLAASLRLPRETCRRRLASLRTAGWLKGEGSKLDLDGPLKARLMALRELLLAIHQRHVDAGEPASSAEDPNGTPKDAKP